MGQRLLVVLIGALVVGNFVGTNLFVKHEMEHVRNSTATLRVEIREQRTLLEEQRVLLNTAACASVLGVAIVTEQDPAAIFQEATRVGSPGAKGLTAEGICYPKDLTGTK